MTTHLLGPLDAIPVGEGRAYAVGDDQIAVFRLRSGDVTAVSAVCPHRGGPIADGLIDEGVVVCPLHGNAYDLRDGCSRTGEAPLRVFDVSVDDGMLVVTADMSAAPS